MKAKEIQDLINFIANSGLDEVNIETDQFKIKVRKNSEVQATVVQAAPAPAPVAAPAPAPAPAAAPAAAPASEPKAESASGNYVEVKSPMIGTFYRSSNPESDPFINVGDKVTAGQTVCIIEAMKLFNEIESDFDGRIVKILIDNSQPVEYDQPLILWEPL